MNTFPIAHVVGVSNHQRKTTSDKRVRIITFSAFFHQQFYGANTWSGDIQSSRETSCKQIPAALNFSPCSMPYWNIGIGGFFAGHWGKNSDANNHKFRELYVHQVTVWYIHSIDALALY